MKLVMVLGAARPGSGASDAPATKIGKRTVLDKPPQAAAVILVSSDTIVRGDQAVLTPIAAGMALKALLDNVYKNYTHFSRLSSSWSGLDHTRKAKPLTPPLNWWHQIKLRPVSISSKEKSLTKLLQRLPGMAWQG
ncbi:hypothetical protein KBY97_00930 [Synechococcus sp. ATX 2A4]|nr:hypothetical protein [Synechococcus sp. ATX 2A4]